MKIIIMIAVFISGITFLFNKKISQLTAQNSSTMVVLDSKDVFPKNEGSKFLVDKSTPHSIEENIKFTKIEAETEIFLNSDNFESRVDECFQGAFCEVDGDPWELYLVLKREAKNGVTDLYIAFLRNKISDPKFRDHYKDVLKNMIQDFYPAEQLDFQMAAYFYYLGDLESSLRIYLELEKKSLRNPKIFKSPKLNIANTFYDLGKFKEALTYYQASLDDQKSTETNDKIASINFINERIEFIKKRLRP